MLSTLHSAGLPASPSHTSARLHPSTALGAARSAPSPSLSPLVPAESRCSSTQPPSCCRAGVELGRVLLAALPAGARAPCSGPCPLRPPCRALQERLFQPCTRTHVVSEPPAHPRGKSHAAAVTLPGCLMLHQHPPPDPPGAPTALLAPIRGRRSAVPCEHPIPRLLAPPGAVRAKQGQVVPWPEVPGTSQAGVTRNKTGFDSFVPSQSPPARARKVGREPGLLGPALPEPTRYQQGHWGGSHEPNEGFCGTE